MRIILLQTIMTDTTITDNTAALSDTSSSSSKTLPRQLTKRVIKKGTRKAAHSAAILSSAANAASAALGAVDALREKASDLKELKESEVGSSHLKDIVNLVNETDLSHLHDEKVSYVTNYVSTGTPSVNVVAKLRAYIRHHFRVNGCTDKTRRDAYIKGPSMFGDRVGLKEAYPMSWDNVLSSIIDEVYNEMLGSSSHIEHKMMVVKQSWPYRVLDVALSLLVTIMSIIVLFTCDIIYSILLVMLILLKATKYLNRVLLPKPMMSVNYDLQIENHCASAYNKIKTLVLGVLNLNNVDTKCLATAYNFAFTAAYQHIWIARQCWHNQLLSLVKRQMTLPLVSRETLRTHWGLALELFCKNFPMDLYHTCPWDHNYKNELFLQHLPAKRRMALVPYIMRYDGFRLYNPITKSFVKANEVQVGKEVEKRDPRCISGKTEDYLAETAPDYYALTKWICSNLWSNDNVIQKIVDGMWFVYTSGLSPVTLGKIISMFENGFGYQKWYFYMGDFSRWDGHVEHAAIQAEVEFYRRLGLDSDVLKLFTAQLTTKGVTQAGIKFQTVGKRASGVVNTSFGNTILGFMFVAYLRNKYDADIKVLQLGDDNIYISNKPLNLNSIIADAKNFGHVLKIKETDVDHLEYCSSYFWNIGDTRVLGPKIGRFLSKGLVPHAPLPKEEVLSHAKGVAVGYKHYMWLPILGDICRIYASMDDVGTKSFIDPNPHKIQLKQAIVDIDMDAVNQHFETLYGFPATMVIDELLSIDFRRTGISVYSQLIEHLLEVDDCATSRTWFY